MEEEKKDYLVKKAQELRAETLKMIYKAKSGHPGGSFSISEIMAVLYYDELRLDPKRPDWSERDRFILSKGHVCPIWYACLADKGFFPKEELNTLRELNSNLQGHPDMRKVSGIDMTSGSLGNGLGIGVGMAITAKLDKKDYRVYIILGDGEIQEGTIWEAAMCAAKYRLDNLVTIVDKNKLQVDGFVDDIMPLGSIYKKWEAFGWNVIEVDGHDVEQIKSAFDSAKEFKGQPTCIIANTIKGKGVSYMENVCEWHGKAPNDSEFEQALIELRGC